MTWHAICNFPWCGSAYFGPSSGQNMGTERELSPLGAGLMQHTWQSWDGWPCYTVAQCGLHSGHTDLNEPEMLNDVICYFLGR